MDFNVMAQSLRHCRQIQAIEYGKSLHSHLIKSGLLNYVFLANNVIAMYGDFVYPGDAHQLFDEIPERNIVSWTTLISAYTRAGQPTDALRVFTRMSELELETPNSFTYSVALKACALAKNIELGKSIHRWVSRSQFRSDTVLMNTVLDMYVKCGCLDDAQKVFDEMSPANLTSWNTIIDGYCREGLMEEAMNLFNRMPEPDAVSWNTIIAGHACKESPKTLEFVRIMHGEDLKLDQFTFPCALKICGCFGFVRMGEQIHCYVVKSGFKLGCFIGSALIDMYAKCGRVNEAINLFHECLSYEGRSVYNQLALWNSMISGFASNEHSGAAFDFVSRVHRSGAVLDSYTFSSVLKVCVNLLDLRVGIQVHGLIVTCGYQLDSIVGSMLIDLYVKCGDIEQALRLFRMLPEKDVVTWSGLIAGCAQQHCNSLAFSLFREMVCLNLGVDQFVVSSLLKAFSSQAGLEGGKQVHAYCVKSGYESELVTVTSLIDMYSKSGEIEDGLTVFKSAVERDAVCWTGIIVGCGQNGRAKEAIGFFEEMLKSGVEPNEITFLGVLSACRHAGLVHEASAFFGSMAADHGLVPCLEHYCCMVDLLGRAGCFEEAERLITNMPYEPDETILGSLLGACGIHKNFKLGKWIAERLLAVTPGDVSIYVTLSNVCAGLGMWDDLTKLREVVREVGMKDAGRSWIEVRN
ncbi:pentatricopeptide repeat-containing protein At4g08210 [Magnolia sinica]|uniref:pentatricopeptide repeat-containing protein At4g08210 n=1 Tax=Magnolia sinica TaxID=86752 RepID=UPI00265ACE85|nr:pentatricopeptide repeat-containing protein At4g08210 [Magnolia sinica]XP_058088198.1 pentatricopeptide repeat-containing protein At4g08210 [Magnolia sinica]XP_058088199.1 pentatricopeptide repeat-containing protein At4g08210 [Magnolia sinica]XP_058088201.1 pentatricopeptide repeat-containing protein At4g08210 [Magnolia sinica]XP_058088202.1 pentatricopeptide repeat-containing protein At4g08210 [Magnolia sinica]